MGKNNGAKAVSILPQFLLPELAFPRHGTTTGIRQPSAPWVGYNSTPDKIIKKKYNEY